MNDYTKDPNYTFHINTYNDTPVNVIRREDTPNFKINDELRNAVYSDMPANLSPEEKAVFIYYKLCNILEYDDDFWYQQKFNKGYNQNLTEDVVSGIKPETKIVCGDFSVVLYQLLSEIEGIEPVIIEQCNDESIFHYLVGFYSDRASVFCEGINLTKNNTIGYSNLNYYISANDLARLKTGIVANGLSGMDPENIMPKIMYEMYIAVTGRAPTSNYENMFYQAQSFYESAGQENENEQSLSELIQELHSEPKVDIPDSAKLFEKRFSAFIDTMHAYGLKDNSAYIAFYNLETIGFFGGRTIDTKVGERLNQNGKDTFKRIVLLQREDTNNIYGFNPQELTFKQYNKDEIDEKLAKGEWIYERDSEKLIDIGEW